MKTILSIIILLLSSPQFLSQTQTLDGGQPEIYLKVVNFNSADVFIEKISNAYCYDRYKLPKLLYSCEDCNGGSAVYSDTIPAKRGWGLCNENEPSPDHYKYGYGVYRVYAKGTNHFFYLDFRDANYVFIQNPLMGADLKIEYDTSGYNQPNPTIFFRWMSLDYSNIWGNCTDGDIKQIWKGRGINLPNVSYFPSNFWQNSLAMGKVNEMWPHLIWGRYSGFNNEDPVSYTLYRGDATGGSIPSEINYIPIAALTNIFDCEDLTVLSPINHPLAVTEPYIALYYLKAQQGSQVSTRTNIVSVFSNINWTNSILLTEENNHPKIMWGDYHETTDEVSGYRIRRRLTVS